MRDERAAAAWGEALLDRGEETERCQNRENQRGEKRQRPAGWTMMLRRIVIRVARVVVVRAVRSTVMSHVLMNMVMSMVMVLAGVRDRRKRSDRRRMDFVMFVVLVERVMMAEREDELDRQSGKPNPVHPRFRPQTAHGNPALKRERMLYHPKVCVRC